MRRFRRYIAGLLPSKADYAGLRNSWRVDLLAGVTVGIVALPLALGFGISSGAGAAAGLVTAIVAGVIAAVFGGSNVQVSGPTGAMVVVLAPVIASHGVGALGLVSVMAGVIVLVAGALRLGRTVAFIPWPVIEGFTVGIAVIIFLQQIPLLTAPSSSTPAHTNVVVTAVTSLFSADPAYLAWALAVVAVVTGCMLFLPRIRSGIPGSLIAIVVTTLLCWLLPNPLGQVGALPTGLPAPALPAVDPGALTGLMLPALTIAALAAIESLLSARVAGSMADTGRFNPDRELVGQGLASVGAGLFGGMPATGAIARTAVAVRSGARTRLAAVSHAAVLALIVTAAAQPAAHIPLAALAGVLMVTATRMVHLGTARSILRSSRSDAAAYIITAVITVSVDLIVAILVGMGVAVILALRAMTRASAAHREAIPEPHQPGDEAIAIIRIDGPLLFTSADRILETLTDIEGARVVILRMSQIELIDATGAHALAEIITQLEARGITVLVKGVQPGHRELFATVGVLDALRHHKHLFSDLDAAVAHARTHAN